MRYSRAAMSEKKFEGISRWCDGEDGDLHAAVRKCFWRDGELDLLLDVGGSVYDVKLKRLDTIRWEGFYALVDHERSELRHCYARMWTNDEGVLLYGRWRQENGAEASWWVDLYPVDHFAVDEKR